MCSYDSDILLLSLYKSVHFDRIVRKRERIPRKSMWIIELSQLLRSVVFRGITYLYRILYMRFLMITVPCRLAQLIISLIPYRLGTVWYAIDTAYRQSLLCTPWADSRSNIRLSSEMSSRQGSYAHPSPYSMDHGEWHGIDHIACHIDQQTSRTPAWLQLRSTTRSS